VLPLIARPRWYHLLNYKEEPLRTRFRHIRSEWVKTEICLINGAPEDECRN
jgi:hypothetical protein